LTDFVLVRHAPAASSEPSAPLTDQGRRDAASTASRLLGWEFESAWSSDLRRASETAEILLAGRPSPSLVRSGLLREVDPPSHRLVVEDPNGYAAWEKAALEGLAGRLWRWVEAADGHSSVLVVSHAGPLRVLICLLLGLAPAAHWAFRVDTASISVVRREGGMGTLLLLNDRCHLGSEPSDAPRGWEMQPTGASLL